MKARYVLRKLPQRVDRIFYERFPEPLHLNLLSIFVALFGSYRAKIEFDLIVRQQYAFCLLKSAEYARSMGLKSVTVIEFGVAAGAGLMNICEISQKLSKITGIDFRLYGFDSGKGLPSPRDYRDHPEGFGEGFFPIINRDALLRSLPQNARLIIGDIRETLPSFMAELSPLSPLGFVAVDVDYYWSAKESLDVLLGAPECYLPMTLVWLDDISFDSANPWAGELLAIREFNEENEKRKIYPFKALRRQRLFKHAGWIDQVHLMHVLDHPWRNATRATSDAIKVLENPYLDYRNLDTCRSSQGTQSLK